MPVTQLSLWPEALRCLQREGSHWNRGWGGSRGLVDREPRVPLHPSQQEGPGSSLVYPNLWPQLRAGASAWEEHTHLQKTRQVTSWGWKPGRTQTPHSVQPTPGPEGLSQDFRNLYLKDSIPSFKLSVSSCILFKSLLEHLLEFLLTMPASP